ncbi:MAG TPA: outer membrane beta-barrel domain-containing protein [Polyangia bacterium]|nr:outer membrane beta-barrel domain-containing protein [Polyangia bacterium]
MQKRLALLVAISISALPLVAQAQRKSPLADAPAIRKRLELRSGRLEVGAGAGTTVGQDFYHSVLINAKLGFHFTDWFSISAVAGFAAANLDTGFKSNVIASLDPDAIPNNRAPSKAAANSTMNKIKFMLGGQLEATPFTGKYSLFGKLFAHYDFYAFVGAAALNYEATTSGTPSCGASGSEAGCAVTGLKLGPTFGVGVHSFINQFLALNLELRDIFAQNNAAGRDVNGDMRVDNNDLGWGSTYIATLNLAFYLPSTADISN